MLWMIDVFHDMIQDVVACLSDEDKGAVVTRMGDLQYPRDSPSNGGGGGGGGMAGGGGSENIEAVMFALEGSASLSNNSYNERDPGSAAACASKKMNCVTVSMSIADLLRDMKTTSKKKTILEELKQQLLHFRFADKLDINRNVLAFKDSVIVLDGDMARIDPIRVHHMTFRNRTSAPSTKTSSS